MSQELSHARSTAVLLLLARLPTVNDDKMSNPAAVLGKAICPLLNINEILLVDGATESMRETKRDL
jgi:hypothetical protein